MADEFNLGGIVPWGRTAAEYEAFFELSEIPVTTRVLDCGGGPASFAAEWANRGYSVTAIDPIYARTSTEIAAAFDDIAARVVQGMWNAHDRFNWDFYGSPERVAELRRQALTSFVDDLDSPVRRGRYVAGRLPNLPFREDAFDLALCSHLLFLYSDEIDEQMHRASVRELLRVAREVRVFPLIDMHGNPSRHLQPVLDQLPAEVEPEIVRTRFEFQCGGRNMLRLSRPA